MFYSDALYILTLGSGTIHYGGSLIPILMCIICVSALIKDWICYQMIIDVYCSGLYFFITMVEI